MDVVCLLVFKSEEGASKVSSHELTSSGLALEFLALANDPSPQVNTYLQ